MQFPVSSASAGACVALLSCWLMMLAGTVAAQTSSPMVERFYGQQQNTMEVDFPVGVPSNYGYLPLHVTLANGGSQPARWAMTVVPHGSYDNVIKDQTFQFDVGPGETIERALLISGGHQRMSHSYSNHMQLLVIPPQVRDMDHRSVRVSGMGRRSGSTTPDAPILIGPGAERKLYNDVDGDYVHSLVLAKAPEDWRGYSQFGSIVLSDDDWQAMEPAARLAIADWTRFGGRLQILGNAPTPSLPAVDEEDGAARSFGAVYVATLEEEDERHTLSKLQAIRTMGAPHHRNVEFQGRPLEDAISRNFISNWSGEVAEMLNSSKNDSWVMLLVLIAFVVMVAPVNLFFLAPSDRRHRLFITTPLISLGAAGILILGVILADGIGGSGHRLVWVESGGEDENRQFIQQWQVSNSGALLGSGFTIQDMALIAPMTGVETAASLDVGADRSQASGGWFSSRTVQAHHLRATRPGRGRLEWAGGSAAATSTFDFPIDTVYATHDGQTWWRATEVLQGEPIHFEEVEESEVFETLKKATAEYPDMIGHTAAEFARRPGYFIAMTEQVPAIETLGSIRWKDFGIISGPIVRP